MKIVEVGIGIVLQKIPDKNQITPHLTSETVQILITKRRAGAVYQDYWEFPGGKAEPDEPIDACVSRELAEEVGVRVRIIGTLPEVIHTYRHATVRLHPRLCMLAADSPAPANLHVAEHRWVTPSELGRYRFPEANEAVTRELLGVLSGGIRG